MLWRFIGVALWGSGIRSSDAGVFGERRLNFSEVRTPPVDRPNAARDDGIVRIAWGR